MIFFVHCVPKIFLGTGKSFGEGFIDFKNFLERYFHAPKRKMAEKIFQKYSAWGEIFWGGFQRVRQVNTREQQYTHSRWGDWWATWEK